MSRLHHNRPARITSLMDRLGLPYHPRDLNLARDELVGALLTLREATREDRRW